MGISEILKTYTADQIENLKNDDRLFGELRRTLIPILKNRYPELENYLNQKDVDDVSSIGTTLRGLTDREINHLMLHGATLCGFQIRTYLKDLI